MYISVGMSRSSLEYLKPMMYSSSYNQRIEKASLWHIELPMAVGKVWSYATDCYKLVLLRVLGMYEKDCHVILLLQLFLIEQLKRTNIVFWQKVPTVLVKADDYARLCNCNV